MRLEADAEDPEMLLDEKTIEDDQLRLIFICCHPALPPDAQVALTLREVCGLTTEDIAHAFLTSAPTIAQRIVRAKAKIRDAGIPYEAPARNELAGRLDYVLSVIYLVFNEGYSAASGASLTRPDLSAEAIRLGRLLVALLPDPEATGLLALMLLHEFAPRRARDAGWRGDPARGPGPLAVASASGSARGRRWCGASWPAARSASTPSRRRSPPSMPARRAWPRPIGRGSSSSTIC